MLNEQLIRKGAVFVKKGVVRAQLPPTLHPWLLLGVSQYNFFYWVVRDNRKYLENTTKLISFSKTPNNW